MFYAAVFYVLVLLLITIISCIKPRNFPKGPLWLPIFGSALTVIKERKKNGMLIEAVTSISKQYASEDVIGFKIGKDRVVMALSMSALKEMMLNKDFDGRPMGPFYETRTWGKRYGIILTDEELWLEQRRFVMRHLKEFGFARKGMVEIIHNEAQQMVIDLKEMMDQTEGKFLLQMKNFGSVYVLNTLWKLMTGLRYDYNNKELKKLQHLLHELFESVDMMGALFSHFPFLRFIAPTLSGYSEFMMVHEKMLKFIEHELHNHKNSFKMENQPLDLMDAYLREMETRGIKNASFFTEKQLLAICLDMFVAGSETTTKTFSFCMLHIIRNPAIQKRCQSEIDRVIGTNRTPQFDDKPNLPYCEAVVLESIRFFILNTFGIPHRALRDTKLCGYNIPKNTMLLGSFLDTSTNPAEWGSNSKDFVPERFLKDNRIYIPDCFVPFGLGRHRCMGELMARTNLFLFLTTLLQKFSFSVPAEHSIPDATPVDGATPSIQPFIALVESR